MDIQPDYKIVVRKEGSEKDLVLIDNLNEFEAQKIFDNIKFPTMNGGYEKIKNWNEMITRKSEINRNLLYIGLGKSTMPGMCSAFILSDSKGLERSSNSSLVKLSDNQSFSLSRSCLAGMRSGWMGFTSSLAWVVIMVKEGITSPVW